MYASGMPIKRILLSWSEYRYKTLASYSLMQFKAW
jgi:hypothetical protein